MEAQSRPSLSPRARSAFRFSSLSMTRSRTTGRIIRVVRPCWPANPCRATLIRMGIFDWLRRERPEALTPDQLRGKLFDAVAAHDDRELAELCERHAAVVVRYFRDWQSLLRELASRASASGTA